MLIYKLLLLIVVVGELLPKFYSYEFFNWHGREMYQDNRAVLCCI